MCPLTQWRACCDVSPVGSAVRHVHGARTGNLRAVDAGQNVWRPRSCGEMARTGPDPGIDPGLHFLTVFSTALSPSLLLRCGLWAIPGRSRLNGTRLGLSLSGRFRCVFVLLGLSQPQTVRSRVNRTRARTSGRASWRDRSPPPPRALAARWAAGCPRRMWPSTASLPSLVPRQAATSLSRRAPPFPSLPLSLPPCLPPSLLPLSLPPSPPSPTRRAPPAGGSR